METQGMAANRIYIKNMVCDRCIMVVQDVLQSMQLPVRKVELGTAYLGQPLTVEQKELLNDKLNRLGFDFLEQPQNIQAEKIKILIIHAVHYAAEPIPVNMSTYLAANLHQDYSLLSHNFSETEGMTIEQFTIAQKMEKTKELLTYGEKSLTDIAYELGYANASYLSAQFKKITGQTPSQFKKKQAAPRLPLDKVKI